MNSREHVKIIDASHLDLMQYCFLQKKAFEDVFLKNNVSSDHLTPEFFQWKYSCPAGNARIAIIEKGNNILASVAMFPLTMSIKEQRFISWHFAEAATLPDARGHGYFNQCMRALISTLEPGEIIFVFPNKNSIQATKKTGFQKIESLEFYFRVNNIFCKKSERPMLNVYMPNQTEYAESLSEKGHASVFRSAEYMNWRYVQKPGNKYYRYSAKSEQKITGNVVATAAQVRGIKILLILEYHFLSTEARSEIMDFVKQVAVNEKCFFTGGYFGSAFKPTFFPTRMYKLPDFFLPKKQILMGIGNPIHSLLQVDWLVQTGDWDAF
jgi:hypothetical protein